MKPYSLANVLREGPNVSHRRTSAAIKPALWGAIVATSGILVWLVLL